jgi:hypothetical protein
MKVTTWVYVTDTSLEKNVWMEEVKKREVEAHKRKSTLIA